MATLAMASIVAACGAASGPGGSSGAAPAGGAAEGTTPIADAAATVHAGAGAAADQPGAVEAEPRPELYVQTFAFLPGTADVVFTVMSAYPDDERPPAFVQRLDAAAGRLAPGAEPVAELPEDLEWFDGVVPGATDGPLLLTARKENEAFASSTLLRLMSGAAVPEPVLDPAVVSGTHGVVAAPDGAQAAVLADDARLLLVDVATGDARELARDLWTVAGGPGGRFGFSPDGTHLALLTTPDVTVSHLDLIDVASGDVRRLVSVPMPDTITEYAFSADGSSIYYVVATPASATATESSPVYDSEMLVVDLAPGATPQSVATVADLTGSRVLPVGMAMSGDEQSVLLLQDDAIWRLDIAGGTATRVTPESETVTGGPLLATVDGQQWLAYGVTHYLGDDSPYPAFGGGTTSLVSEVRVMALD